MSSIGEVLYIDTNGNTRCIHLGLPVLVENLRNALSCNEKVHKEFLVLRQNGLVLTDDCYIDDHALLTVSLKVFGGKGGFGSLLRSFGTQIHKNSNREACRDLSGRRMRDVNNEKRLREWAAKQAERKEEEDRARKEKREKLLAGPKHSFHDPEFEKQSRAAVDNVQDAVDQGLRLSISNSSSDVNAPSTSGLSAGVSKLKRKAITSSSDKMDDSSIKKARFWLGPGLDEDDLSSSDDDDDGGIVSGDVGVGVPAGLVSGAGPGGSGGFMFVGCGPGGGLDMPREVDSIKTDSTAMSSPDSSLADSESVKSVENHMTKLFNQTTATPPVSTGKGSDTPTDEKSRINLGQYNSPAELEELGLERLKLALMSLGLKCGGTLQQRAERLFSVKGLGKDKIDPGLFAKPQKAKKNRPS